WSSDVCSSDLYYLVRNVQHLIHQHPSSQPPINIKYYDLVLTLSYFYYLCKKNIFRNTLYISIKSFAFHYKFDIINLITASFYSLKVKSLFVKGKCHVLLRITRCMINEIYHDNCMGIAYWCCISIHIIKYGWRHIQYGTIHCIFWCCIYYHSYYGYCSKDRYGPVNGKGVGIRFSISCPCFLLKSMLFTHIFTACFITLDKS